MSRTKLENIRGILRGTQKSVLQDDSQDAMYRDISLDELTKIPLAAYRN